MGTRSVRSVLIFSMAEWVKLAHLNRLLPSSAELKRLYMRKKEEYWGDLLPTKRYHDFTKVTSPV